MKSAVVLIALTSAVAGCSGAEQTATAPAMSQSAPAMTAHAPAMTAQAPAMSAARTGTIQGLNGKVVAGTVRVDAGQVHLSGFSAQGGTGLHAYLTAGTDPDAIKQGASLGAVDPAAASQTFPVAGVDASKYDTVVIRSDDTDVVFGAATLV